MISLSLNDVVDNAKILTSFCSDHSCVTLKLNPLPVESRGAGYWKFNASLTNDAEYINQLNRLLDLWTAEYDYILDRRVVWDLLKYEIRRFTCEYCAKKKKDNKKEEQYLHRRLEDLEIKLGTTSDNSTNTEYYECKERLMEIEKVKAEWAIIRSKVKFIEEGETQYFFGLEKFNYIKKTRSETYT